MSFGFSVGDVIAASKVIRNIVNSPHPINEARSEYQKPIRELGIIDNALYLSDRLEELDDDGASSIRSGSQESGSHNSSSQDLSARSSWSDASQYG